MGEGAREIERGSEREVSAQLVMLAPMINCRIVLMCVLCCLVLFNYLYFSHFAAVSLCGVAGLAQTYPSPPVSDPFLPDLSGFHVPPDIVFPSRPRS